MIRSRLVPLLSAAVLLMAGSSCSSDGLPTAPTTPPASVSPDLLGGLLGGLGGLLNNLPLLKCNPLPYAADTAVIGPAGGTLTIGANQLVIPAGALSQPIEIIGEAPTDTVNSVRFQPQGLQFAKPATLTLDYHNCPLLRNLLPKQIVYTTDSLNILSLLPSLDNLLTEKVSAPIKHFSRYAIAW